MIIVVGTSTSGMAIGRLVCNATLAYSANAWCSIASHELAAVCQQHRHDFDLQLATWHETGRLIERSPDCFMRSLRTTGLTWGCSLASNIVRRITEFSDDVVYPFA
ncbi:hypothetical protein [Catellatospora citrea]|uniref:hypothetical protein n=1 Tax=Catellatospora citrea TaxID=53366 RepID=UPI0011C3ACB8|nr:hypothetical protein [Catellatospora citrea]